MSIYNYKQRNATVGIILLILAAAIFYSVRIIAGTLLSTVVLYTILRPVLLFLVDRWRWKRWIAAIALIASSLIIIIIPFFTLTVLVIHKVSDLKESSYRIKTFTDQITKIVGKESHILDKASQKLEGLVSELFPSLIGSVLDTVLGLLVMYFLLYFMFVQRKEFEACLLKYAPFRMQQALEFAHELKNTTYSNVLGQGLIAIVQGTLVGVGFWIFGISDPVFWGTISGFASFLPIVGSPIIFVPAAIIEIGQGNEFAGWGLLLWGFIIVTNIDNVIRFTIAKRLANTHPVITVIGVIIGIPMFGVLGLVFGPLLLSYFILTVKIYEINVLVSRRLDRIRTSGKRRKAISASSDKK